ncbi:hypothetical protein Pla52n_38480 [Stieleria varia]|uniref:Uncharacterized protein n=1 Tax=Stieleria varia TaxID=2528005 RepID=A0A5C6AUB1_9BACT|nr:hypothetical protein Pla52n_38480 [Stieleria varia]
MTRLRIRRRDIESTPYIEQLRLRLGYVAKRLGTCEKCVSYLFFEITRSGDCYVDVATLMFRTSPGFGREVAHANPRKTPTS